MPYHWFSSYRKLEQSRRISSFLMHVSYASLDIHSASRNCSIDRGSKAPRMRWNSRTRSFSNPVSSLKPHKRRYAGRSRVSARRSSSSGASFSKQARACFSKPISVRNSSKRLLAVDSSRITFNSFLRGRNISSQSSTHLNLEHSV